MTNRIQAFETGLQLFAELIRIRLQCLSSGAASPAPDHLAHELAELPLVPGRTLDFAQSVLLLSAVAPHLAPNLFDSLFAEHLPEAGDFPHIGGARGQQFRGFLPTAETVLFLLDDSMPEAFGDASPLAIRLHHLDRTGTA